MSVIVIMKPIITGTNLKLILKKQNKTESFIWRKLSFYNNLKIKHLLCNGISVGVMFYLTLKMSSVHLFTKNK